MGEGRGGKGASGDCPVAADGHTDSGACQVRGEAVAREGPLAGRVRSGKDCGRGEGGRNKCGSADGGGEEPGGGNLMSKSAAEVVTPHTLRRTRARTCAEAGKASGQSE